MLLDMQVVGVQHVWYRAGDVDSDVVLVVR
jgi:hypothetical protein